MKSLTVFGFLHHIRAGRSLAVAICLAGNALGGTITDPFYDVNEKIIVEPGGMATAGVIFTKDGATVGSAQRVFKNGASTRLTFSFVAAAPAGTNDSSYGVNYGVLALGGGPVQGTRDLLSGQVADFGDFLASKGFFGSSTFDSPIGIACPDSDGLVSGADFSLFAKIDNLSAFLPFALQTNFPLGELVTTNSSGGLAGIPGFTFYRDSSFTTPYSNSQVLVVGITSEAATPEPSTFGLLGLGALAIIGYRYFSHAGHRNVSAG